VSTSSAHFVTLLVTIIGGIGVISMGVWRIAAAVFKLAGKVDLLAYRMEQIEGRQGGPQPAAPRYKAR
jgi:hypothetical protein